MTHVQQCCGHSLGKPRGLLAAQGVPPCSLVVSDAGGGAFVVVDSTGAALFSTLRVLGVSDYGDLAVAYDVAAGSWSPVGPLPPRPASNSAARARLHDGSILEAGGLVGDAGAPEDGSSLTLRSAMRFSPATLAFAPAANLTTPRAFFQLVTAFDGAALAIGGLSYFTSYANTDDAQLTGSIEAYDRFADAWAPAGALLTPRDNHISVVLSSGKVLTAGGYDMSGLATSTAELYDKRLQTSTATAPMSSARVGHQMVLLADGTALACGGLYLSSDAPFPEVTYLLTCDLYDESTGLWEPTGNLPARPTPPEAGDPGYRVWVNFAMWLLPNGQVLASAASSGVEAYPCVAEFAIYDPQARSWSTPAPVPFSYGPQTLLPTGEVLLTNAYTSVAECQDNAYSGTLYPATNLLYNPLAGSQRVTGSLPGFEELGADLAVFLSSSVLF